VTIRCMVSAVASMPGSMVAVIIVVVLVVVALGVIVALLVYRQKRKDRTPIRESLSQTSKNRLTAPPSVAAPPAILSSRDRSIAGYS